MTTQAPRGGQDAADLPNDGLHHGARTWHHGEDVAARDVRLPRARRYDDQPLRVQTVHGGVRPTRLMTHPLP